MENARSGQTDSEQRRGSGRQDDVAGSIATKSSNAGPVTKLTFTPPPGYQNWLGSSAGNTTAPGSELKRKAQQKDHDAVPRKKRHDSVIDDSQLGQGLTDGGVAIEDSGQESQRDAWAWNASGGIDWSLGGPPLDQQQEYNMLSQPQDQTHETLHLSSPISIANSNNLSAATGELAAPLRARLTLMLEFVGDASVQEHLERAHLRGNKTASGLDRFVPAFEPRQVKETISPGHDTSVESTAPALRPDVVPGNVAANTKSRRPLVTSGPQDPATLRSGDNSRSLN